MTSQPIISFDGAVALVTGGASGIGRASAVLLASVGARVVVADRDAGGGEATRDAIREQGGEADFVEVDVSDAAAVDAMMAATIDRFGRLDCAFNNAGVESPSALTGDYSEEEWDRSIAVNLKAVWLCMRAELRQMAEQGGGGAIVNTASVGGLLAVPMNASYAAAKHGVIGLTKTAAVEYASRAIRVNAICPGYTRSALTDRITAASPAAFNLDAIPIGRPAEPEEMAGIVAFLCSRQASYLTGASITIDGGFSVA